MTIKTLTTHWQTNNWYRNTRADRDECWGNKRHCFFGFLEFRRQKWELFDRLFFSSKTDDYRLTFDVGASEREVYMWYKSPSDIEVS